MTILNFRQSYILSVYALYYWKSLTSNDEDKIRIPIDSIFKIYPNEVVFANGEAMIFSSYFSREFCICQSINGLSGLDYDQRNEEIIVTNPMVFYGVLCSYCHVNFINAFCRRTQTLLGLDREGHPISNPRFTDTKFRTKKIVI